MNINEHGFDEQFIAYVAKMFTDFNADNFFDPVIHRTIDKNLSISAVEGHLLSFFIKTMDIKHIIEVGTFLGVSTAYMANALPADGTITTIDRSERYLNMARDNLKFHLTPSVFAKITFIHGDAQQVLVDMTQRQYCMMFIDANKSRYIEYLRWADNYVRKNGLIIADNTLLFGAAYDPDHELKNHAMTRKLKEFNTCIANQDKYCSMIVPTPHGLTIARKLD